MSCPNKIVINHSSSSSSTFFHGTILKEQLLSVLTNQHNTCCLFQKVAVESARHPLISMYQIEDSAQTDSQVNMVDDDQEVQTYGIGEVIWGFVLLIGIFTVNIAVLWVVGKSRELWKPRHLWMACLCITDIFVGAHKALELLLYALPYLELCVLQR